MAKNLDDSVHNTGMQFRIVDLLVITTSFAVGMAIQEANVKLGLSILMQTDYGWFNVISRTVFAAICGLPLAAIYCLAINRRCSKKTLIQPGHWLLLSMLCGTIASAFRILGALFSHGFLYSQWEFYQTDLVLNAMLSLGTAAILFWAGKQNSGSWRKVLFLCAFSFTLWAIDCALMVFLSPSVTLMDVLQVTDWIEALLNVIIAIFLSVLAIVELKNKVRRDLWHWLGVFVAFLVVTAVPMMNFIYSMFGLAFVCR